MAVDWGMVRLEHDALGAVEVPAERLWGAQTERSRHFFAIGVPRFVWTRPVIRALGVNDEVARGSIRFSFGKDNTDDDVDYTVEVLSQAVERLRALSPLTLVSQ